MLHVGLPGGKKYKKNKLYYLRYIYISMYVTEISKINIYNI